MILQSIKTEHTDNKTGLVVKRITTSEWQHLNHKMAIGNFMFGCEKQRIRFGKPIHNSPFQIHHITYDNKLRHWRLDAISPSQAHAQTQNRLFLPFQQRTEGQWANLIFQEAENDFQTLATKGLTFVPYSIPLNASLEEWKTRRSNAVSVLNTSQTLVPVFCSKHQTSSFEEIFNYEFEHSKLIGIQCYCLTDADTALNLAKVKQRNMRLQTGDDAPLLIALSYGKVQRSFENVSGSFAHACLGFDIFSERQISLANMPEKVAEKIINTPPEEMMRYDASLGGFNLTAEQQLEGMNLTRAFLENITLSEGLTAHQAIQWASHIEQQRDFDTLNTHILETANNPEATLQFIKNEKEKWAVYWRMKFPEIHT